MTRRLPLLLQVPGEIGGGESVEVIPPGQHLLGFLAGECADGPRESAQCPSGLDGPAKHVAVPEGHRRSRFSRRRDYFDPVGRDVVDSPGRGAEDEHVAHP